MTEKINETLENAAIKERNPDEQVPRYFGHQR
jgi:hypothetical protein